MGNPSPRYTAEFKQRAVELYRAAGPDATYASVARELGCDAGSLSKWVSLADGKGASDAEQNPFQMAEEIKRAEAGERSPQEGQRDTFKSERLLRQQAAVGAAAKRAKFEFVAEHEGDWSISDMCRVLASPAKATTPTSRGRRARTMSGTWSWPGSSATNTRRAAACTARPRCS